MAQTRRSFLAGIAVGTQEWVRYQDPATEFDVRRLTSPQHESLLPAAPARAVDRKAKTLLFAARTDGAWAPYLMDLGNGQIRPLPEAPDFQPETLTFTPDDRAVLCFHGPDLTSAALNNHKAQSLARVRDGWARSGCIAPTDDGQSYFFVETQGETAHIRRLHRAKGAPETAVETRGTVLEVTPNPKRAMLLWRTPEGALWVAPFEGGAPRQVETPAGKVLQAHWSPDGQKIVYLLAPAELNQLNALREQTLDRKDDALLAKTSQFAAFNRNSNSSVFLGASRSKASPNILLLLRATRREFTLCEHKASNPALCAPTFSANSQKVFFQSDRHGRMAIYMMGVEKLIEKTDS